MYEGRRGTITEGWGSELTQLANNHHTRTSLSLQVAVWLSQVFSQTQTVNSAKMNYELDGQMIMAIMPPKPEVSVRVVAQPDVEQLEMLEMEIEALNAELDDERSMARAQQMKCDKHLRDLKAAELELSNCRKGLDRSMQEVENARAEMKRKAHEQASTEEQLQRSKLLLEQSTRERSLGREVRTQGKHSCQSCHSNY